MAVGMGMVVTVQVVMGMGVSVVMLMGMDMLVRMGNPVVGVLMGMGMFMRMGVAATHGMFRSVMHKNNSFSFFFYYTDDCPHCQIGIYFGIVIVSTI